MVDASPIIYFIFQLRHNRLPYTFVQMQCTFRSRSIGISNKCTIQRLDSFLWFSESHIREAAPVFLFPLSLFASQNSICKKNYNGTIKNAKIHSTFS